MNPSSKPRDPDRLQCIIASRALYLTLGTGMFAVPGGELPFIHVIYEHVALARMSPFLSAMEKRHVHPAVYVWQMKPLEFEVAVLFDLADPGIETSEAVLGKQMVSPFIRIRATGEATMPSYPVQIFLSLFEKLRSATILVGTAPSEQEKTEEVFTHRFDVEKVERFMPGLP